jgi:hypothetical protein
MAEARTGNWRIAVSKARCIKLVISRLAAGPGYGSSVAHGCPSFAQAGAKTGKYPNHGQSCSRAGHAPSSGLTCLLWMTKSQLQPSSCRLNCARRSVE